MSKLFNFAQAKGKWHKFHSFNLGRGAKLYKNFAQKLLAVSLCMAVVLLGTPVTTFATEVVGEAVLTNTTVTGVTAPSGSELKDVTKVVIPADATDIAADAFDQCTNLATFAVASGNTAFAVGTEDAGDPGVLYNAGKTTLYRLPPAFEGEYSLPATVTKIMDGAFTNCSGLTTFNLGSTDLQLEWTDFSFAGCSALKSFTGGLGYAPGSFYGADRYLQFTSAMGYYAVRLAPAWSDPVVASPGYVRVDYAASLFAGCSSLAGLLLLADSGHPLPSTLSLSGMFGAPVLVPAESVSSLSLGSDPASVLGYTEGEFDSALGVTPLSLTSRTGNTKKPLNLACNTFIGYKLAIKDGEKIPNLTITHSGTPGANCSACGAPIPVVPVTGVELNYEELDLEVSASATLTATVEPSDATDPTVTWESSAPTVASVDNNGVVAAVAPGTAEITVTTADGRFTDTCTVTVTQPVEDEAPVVEDPDLLTPVDRSSWGTPYVREADGVTQYVVEDPTSPDFGMTSVELVDAWASAGGGSSAAIFWVHESSGGSSAWYGVAAASVSHLCARGYRFYVQWLSPGDPGYDVLFDRLNDEDKQRVEDDNGWLFNMGVRAPDGTDVHYLVTDEVVKQPIVYVQIGDDWDVDDLNAYYLAVGGNEKVPVDYLMIDYPEGTDTFGRMTLDHFSPYFIFDELNAEELAALKNNQNQTGDLATQLLISGLSIVLVSSLGVMLRLITNKRKFEE